MALGGIRYTRRPKPSLNIINQLALPSRTEWLTIVDINAACHAIKTMQVRGAPAIAIVAVLSLVVQMSNPDCKVYKLGSGKVKHANITSSFSPQYEYIISALNKLVDSRPTAVNMADARARFIEASKEKGGEDLVNFYFDWAEKFFDDDIKANREIGRLGAEWALKNAWNGRGQCAILTHCNTGSLATAGYGTALGIIRSLHEAKRLSRVFVGETRPYNQGARLTVYELVHDSIPVTLITDSMAAAALARTDDENEIAAIVVGADRLARNGDTANKIGTYGLAVLAKFHKAKFIVAAPTTTVDLGTETGKEIVIEERAAHELTTVAGAVVGSDNIERIQIAADGCDVWNPAFDVTPAALIDAIVTDKGVLERDDDGQYDCTKLFK
ncbi:MAG: S-methyl-5-thioribose-1-phosphate isomerase [Vezdaea aestivalis]|nr:MAG: S-methyl-5-thioribose-1-phosphate isomerase [Vezdaea aestivalis]